MIPVTDSIKFKDIAQFSTRDTVYQESPSIFKEFYHYSADLAGFKQKISARKKQNINRELLQKVIKSQYAKIEHSAKIKNQLNLLSKEDTFTVVTAHQPGLFTGPLYYISKIASCIKLTRQLNEEFPQNHIIPIFVHGGEDHDFEEVNHFYLFKQKIEWKNEGIGAVGRFSIEGLQDVEDQVKDMLERELKFDNWETIFNKAIVNASSYGDFVFRIVHGLFGHTELLQINMDNAELKRSFIPILRKEILERPSQKYIFETQKAIQAIGYKAQAFPREINLFLHSNYGRNRIDYDGKLYTIVDTPLQYTEAELLDLLKQSPESFSPNVVMRPLYQEHCLPNLCYIGGGGELAYWLERKTQFEYFDMELPILMRRDSYLYLNKSTLKNIDKLSMSLRDFLPHIDEIIHRHIVSTSTTEIDLSLEKNKIKNIYDAIAEKAKLADPTLAKATISEYHKQIKAIDSIESRIKRAYKSKEEQNINKIRKVKDTLFPNNSLQERKENFLALYTRYGQLFINELITLADPLDPSVKIFSAEVMLSTAD